VSSYPKTIKKWEQCRDKAESSVNQQEVGISGVEYEIKSKCGDPPAKEPGSTTGAVGMHPYDLVRSKTWKSKFVAITKGKYKSFVERLKVSSETNLEGDWITGAGQAPHMGGSEEAALAINAKSGEVYGAMLEDGKTLSGFGFGTSWENAPKFIKEWAADHKQ
jgi:hypothetical protein